MNEAKPNLKGRPWTAKDDEFILKHHHEMTLVEIGKGINRNPSLVSKHVKKLGIRKNGLSKWSPLKQAFLEENFGRLSLAAIARHLQSPETTVRYHARSLRGEKKMVPGPESRVYRGSGVAPENEKHFKPSG